MQKLGFVFAVCVLLAVVLHASSEPALEVPLELEVRLERGQGVVDVDVVLRNTSEDAYRFDTGSRGGLEVRTKPFALGPRVFGSAPTVLPELFFTYEGAVLVTITAPLFGGPTKQRMGPVHFEVPAGAEASYYRFQVPAKYAAGELQEARLKVGDQTLRWTPE